MSGVLASVDKLLKYFEETIMILAGILLFCIMVFTVIARYFLHMPTPYDSELTKIFHIWMVFAGASYLVGKDGHPAVELLSSKIKDSSNIIWKKIYFSCIYAIMLLFIVPTLIFGLKSLPLYAKQVTTYLSISYVVVYGGGILGMFFMIIRCILKITKIWREEE